MKHPLPVVVIATGLTLLSGCAMSNTVYEDLPIAVTRGAPKSEPVPVYESGINNPPRAVIPFARIAAHGNGYATRQSLMGDLGRRGAKLGADCVYVGQPVANNAGSVTSYGGGVAISSPVQTLSLYGMACVWSPVRLGVYWNDQNIIVDVVPGSPAARAGMRINERVLSVNGKRVSADSMAAYRGISTAKPGDSLPIEVVGADGNVQMLTLICEAND